MCHENEMFNALLRGSLIKISNNKNSIFCSYRNMQQDFILHITSPPYPSSFIWLGTRNERMKTLSTTVRSSQDFKITEKIDKQNKLFGSWYPSSFCIKLSCLVVRHSIPFFNKSLFTPLHCWIACLAWVPLNNSSWIVSDFSSFTPFPFSQSR